MLALIAFPDNVFFFRCHYVPAADADSDEKQAELCRTQTTNNLSEFIHLAGSGSRKTTADHSRVQFNDSLAWIYILLQLFFRFGARRDVLGGRCGSLTSPTHFVRSQSSVN